MNEKIPSTRWLRIIMPMLITCIMSFMDRVNISFALPGGVEADLGITSQIVDMASGVFFIGYLFLQIPGGRITVNDSGKKLIAWSLATWAIVSVATGFVIHQYQLLVLRFTPGVSEGGMLPVVLTMVSNQFPEKELGRVNAFVMMSAPLGGMLTAPVSGATIAALDWRWLFVIEGLLSLVVPVAWWFMISDRPQEAHWLPARERDYLVAILAAERAAKQTEAPVSKAPVKGVFGNAGLMKLVILNPFYQAGDCGYTLWLPTILKGLAGGNMASVGSLAVLPFVATLAGIYVISLFSDHSDKRRLWVCFSFYSFAATLVASVVLRDHMMAAYIALVICGFFLKPATSPFWSMPGRIASLEVAGSARGVINGLGNLGGFCGPYLVGAMTYLYSQNVAACALASPSIIAGTMTFLLPKQCDLVDNNSNVAIKEQPQNA